jgi:hypothetical protein
MDAAILAVSHEEYSGFTPQSISSVVRDRGVIVDVKSRLEPEVFKSCGYSYWRM